MKTIIFLSLIFPLTFLDVNGQTKNMSRMDKNLIDTTNVDYITITGGWTAYVKNKKLSVKQVKMLAEKWNSAQEIKTIKPMNDFRIDIYLKKGKRRTLSGAGRLISEKRNHWYDLMDSNFIDKLLMEMD